MILHADVTRQFQQVNRPIGLPLLHRLEFTIPGLNLCDVVIL